MFYKLEGVIIMNQFQFFKLLFVLFLVFFIYQCEDTINDPALSDSESATLLKGGNRGGGGGNGGNGGGGNGGVNDYGDLVVCLRNADGVPIYKLIDGEHGLEYFPYPIKFNETTLIPETVYATYDTFSLNVEGEVIAEAGFIVKEADFGRLSLTRAPQRVLDAALLEAINALTGKTIKTDASGRLVAINGFEDWLVNFDDDPLNDEDDDKTIDSPRENMAIYQELMSNGFTGDLAFLNPVGSVLDLAIGALAAGADKTGNVGVDEVAYMNDWYLDWDNLLDEIGPDDKGRSYFNYAGFSYDRQLTYGDKYVRIRTLNPDQTWKEEFVSLHTALEYDIGTALEKIIDYSGNTNITGFAKAVDDAIQVLEFIHSSDLIVYSPYFEPVP